MTDRKKIQVDVYVRLDASETGREVSFRIPDDIPQHELLDKGYAIDGNSALTGVSAYGTGEDFVSLADALREQQQSLRTWLDEKGYTVVFK